MKRIFLVAGESSGDLHGAHLVRALREADPEIVCEGLGGRRMFEAGMELRCNLAERAIMGFAEIVRSFPFVRALFHDTVKRLGESRPMVLVLIDYPGFNMRLAREAKRIGIPVVYYISPQVWAWKRGRVKTLANLVDKMLVIFPFEEAIYREAGVDCVYVGHPLLDHIVTTPVSDRFAGDLLVGVLPGSREQEIRRIAPVMLATARGIRERYPNARFAAPCVDAAREKQLRAVAGDFPLETVVGEVYDVLRGAHFCLVASGTATLETAYFNVPMAIVYKVAPLSYALARRLVRIEHIGMVNILAGRRIVPEFVQHEACLERVLPAALELMGDTPARREMLEALAEVKTRLGEPGASRRAATEVLNVMGKGGHV